MTIAWNEQFMLTGFALHNARYSEAMFGIRHRRAASQTGPSPRLGAWRLQTLATAAWRGN